jgi:uncharacterized RDD family membrane protein YckC
MAQGWAPQTQTGPASGVTFGGFWIRFVAWIIDAVLIGIVQGVLQSVVGPSAAGISFVITAVYFIGMWGYLGQTVGMMPFNLHIVKNADGSKITYGTAALRYLGYLLSALCLLIGLIWVAFDARKRGWHDMIAGTVVVRNA